MHIAIYSIHLQYFNNFDILCSPTLHWLNPSTVNFCTTTANHYIAAHHVSQGQSLPGLCNHLTCSSIFVFVWAMCVVFVVVQANKCLKCIVSFIILIILFWSYYRWNITVCCKTEHYDMGRAGHMRSPYPTYNASIASMYIFNQWFCHQKQHVVPFWTFWV